MQPPVLQGDELPPPVEPPSAGTAPGVGRITGVEGLGKVRGGRLSTAARAFLRFPLFHKIVWATGAAVAGSALLTGVLLLGWTPVEVEPVAGVVAIPALLAVIVVGLLTSVLVHLALAPLRGLTDAARRVAAGEEGARAPTSPLADEETGELIEVFNGMLDRLDEDRESRRRHALRILEAQEEERRRLAEGLYGGVAQTLAAVLLRLRAGSSGNGDGEEVREALVEALEGIRRTARALSPPELRDIGVERALEACARNLAEGGGSPVDVVVAGEAGRLEPATAHTLYRIVEESLRDLATRPGEGRVEVHLGGNLEEVEAEIRDGRTPHAGTTHPDATHVGTTTGEPGWVRELQERARYVGGTMEVDAGDDGSRRIRLRMPRVPRA